MMKGHLSISAPVLELSPMVRMCTCTRTESHGQNVHLYVIVNKNRGLFREHYDPLKVGRTIWPWNTKSLLHLTHRPYHTHEYDVI